MVTTVSPSTLRPQRPERERPTWTRAQVRGLVSMVALSVAHVAAVALYVLGG
jgi:hypothetical protein